MHIQRELEKLLPEMSKKNILYVSARPLEDNSSASFRNRATMSGLLKNGHQVEFLTLEPDSSHPTFDGNIKLDGLKVRYLSQGRAESIAHYARGSKLFTFLKKLYHLFRRVDIYDHTSAITRHAKNIDISKFDLIISSSDPKSSHLFVGEILRQNDNKVPWIQIWGDPFASDITVKDNRKRKAMQVEEDRLLNLATRVVYVSKLTAEDQKKRYPQYDKKIVYIPTPYFEPLLSDRPFPTTLSKLKLCYCGEYHSSVRNIYPLYEAAKQMHLSLTICGRSDKPVDSVDNITSYPRLSAEKVEQIEAESDILVVVANSHGGQIPGKVYKYAATDKTILFILDGEKDKILDVFGGFNRYIFVNNNIQDICTLLGDIFSIRDKYNSEPLAAFSSTVVAGEIVKDIK